MVSVVGSAASLGARNTASSLTESIWIVRIRLASMLAPSAVASSTRSTMRWLRAP